MNASNESKMHTRVVLVLAALALAMAAPACGQESGAPGGWGSQAANGAGTSGGTNPGSSPGAGSGGGAGSGSASSSGAGSSSSSGGGSVPPSQPPQAGGFQQTVAPLLDQAGCTECHHHGRSIDLTTYPFMAGSASDTASQLLSSLTTNMPPAPRTAAPSSVLAAVQTWIAAGTKP